MSDTDIRALKTELRRTLAYHLYGDASHPITGHTEEDIKIDFLLETFGEYLIGGYDTEDLAEIFRRHPVPGFDVLLWINQKEAEGVLAPDQVID